MMKIMIKYNSITEILTGAPNDTEHQNNALPKKQSYRLWWVLLTNAQCHIVPISILWCDLENTELYNWNVPLKPDRNQ